MSRAPYASTSGPGGTSKAGAGPDLGLIWERAAVAQAAALLPIPFVEDLLADAARATLLRRIADQRGVGASDAALSILSRVALVEDGGLSMGSARRVSRRLLGKTFRRVAAALHIASHAGDFATTFALATLFDHYCARHHVGAGLDAARATELRAVIDAATVEARGELARLGARGAARTTSQLLLAAPRAVIALGRRPRGLLGQGEPAPDAPDAPERVDPTEVPRRAGGTMLQRSIRAVTGLAGDTGRRWLDALIAAFDRRWAEHVGARTSLARAPGDTSAAPPPVPPAPATPAPPPSPSPSSRSRS